jgi:hypothetical protein
LFHLFLYLCTLEILPIIVAAKFLSKYFFSWERKNGCRW